jgi:DNA-directed RNA polymerase subunit RPC12/RpoP
MTTTTYTCDRCGNEIDGERTGVTTWRSDDVVIRNVTANYLCPPCGDKLRALLHGVPA